MAFYDNCHAGLPGAVCFAQRSSEGPHTAVDHAKQYPEVQNHMGPWGAFAKLLELSFTSSTRGT